MKQCGVQNPVVWYPMCGRPEVISKQAAENEVALGVAVPLPLKRQVELDNGKKILVPVYRMTPVKVYRWQKRWFPYMNAPISVPSNGSLIMNGGI